MIRHYRRYIAIIVVLVVLPLVTPLSYGLGGRACGPEDMWLYRFVKDDYLVWYGRGWEVYSFHDACQVHDRCYHRPLDFRMNCDNQFREDMAQVCDVGMHTFSRAYCRLIARGFYGSVRLFGWIAYDWDDMHELTAPE